MLEMFKALTILGIVVKWSQKALKDGKITITEAADLAQQIAPILGIPTDIIMPENPVDQPETVIKE